ncbi:MAG: TerB family tellurite resistance protein [Fimbriimonadaceae bacterium]
MENLRARQETIALRSYATLVEACRTLSDEGGWRDRDEICRALARTVARMLVRIGGADGNLDPCEHQLIASLIRLDRTYDGLLEAALAEAPADAIPDCSASIVRAATEFDAREGTSLAREAAEAFESLAFAVVGADGRIVLAELDSLQRWVDGLYGALGERESPQARGERVKVGA